MEGSEDNSDNSVDYSAGSEDNFSDNSGNYTDYLDGAILERSNSLLEDRAINTCGCAPVSSSNRIVGGKEVNPKGKLPYQVYFIALYVFPNIVYSPYIQVSERTYSINSISNGFIHNLANP